MRPPAPPQESFVELAFPPAGIDLSNGFSSQRPRPMPSGEWGRTCQSGINVLGFEPGTGRGRGGSRPGLTKYIAQAVVADWINQDLGVVVTEGQGVGQLSQSGRNVYVVTVSQGNVYWALPGSTTWTLATNNTGANPPLNYTGIVFGTACNQKYFFADGANYAYFDPTDKSVNRLVASAGSLPVDSKNNTPRLVALWRGRLLWSGLVGDPQNIFASKVSQPTDYNYGDAAVPPDMAWALNASPLGLIGDPVTCLIPYNDDVLLVGGDHTVNLINGDPMSGGQIDLVTNAIGMAWGAPWARDPYGSIYFVSNKTGIYQFTPGQQPQRISQAIEQLLLPIDTGLNSIRLAWNDRFQGLHVFVTPTAAAAAATHFFWEQRTGAWWEVTFGNNNHNPLALCVFDGNTPGDRVVLLGSWDGYVRSFSPTATDDDGTAISSSVVIGPLTSKDMYDLLMKDLQAELGETSGSVTYSIFTGNTAEAALASTAIATGTWGPSRSLNVPIRQAAFALYVKITATVPWAMERIRVRIAETGKVKGRQRGLS